MNKYDDLVAAGLGCRLHPVAHRIFGTDTCCRRQLGQFCDDEGSRLRDFPIAFMIIFQYALLPLVGRRVEEMHAKLKRLAGRSTYIKPPAIAAPMREIDHLKRLETCS